MRPASSFVFILSILTLAKLSSRGNFAFASFVASQHHQPLQEAFIPIGATYHRQMKFPVLGRQAFQLDILSHDKARLRITGVLSVDEVVAYSVGIGGQLSFSLSKRTQHVLKRFKTKLLEAGYDHHSDTPYVKVAPYVLPPVKINMGRIA